MYKNVYVYLCVFISIRTYVAHRDPLLRGPLIFKIYSKNRKNTNLPFYGNFLVCFLSISVVVFQQWKSKGSERVSPLIGQ